MQMGHWGEKKMFPKENDLLTRRCKDTNNSRTQERYDSTPLLPGRQPFEGAQKNRLKSTSFQERQDWAQLTLDLGKSICGVFRSREPVRIANLPFFNELLDT